MEALTAALAEDGEQLLSSDEQAEIYQVIDELAQAAQGTKHLAIKLSIEKADKVSADFAQRRIDSSINKALTGRSVDDIG